MTTITSDGEAAPEVSDQEGTSAEAKQILDALFFEGSRRVPYLWRFWWLMVMSSSIAAFGLLSDSAAVVIGAMLIAPLMTPILATGGALVRAEAPRLLRSLAVLGLGMATAIGVAWVVGAISGIDLTEESTIPGEILSRTQPGLLDLGVAVSAGAAGGYVLTRPEAGSALPGVGIAVALVPPLATAGVLLQGDQPALARGALLLFSTNLAAITLSAAVVFLVSHFVPWSVIKRAWRQVGIGLVVVVAMLAAVAVPLTFHTLSVIEDRAFRTNVTSAVRTWDETVRIVSLETDVVEGVGRVELSVAGPNDPLPAWRLADIIHASFGGPIDVLLDHDKVEGFAVSVR